MLQHPEDFEGFLCEEDKAIGRNKLACIAREHTPILPLCHESYAHKFTFQLCTVCVFGTVGIGMSFSHFATKFFKNCYTACVCVVSPLKQCQFSGHGRILVLNHSTAMYFKKLKVHWNHC